MLPVPLRQLGTLKKECIVKVERGAEGGSTVGSSAGYLQHTGNEFQTNLGYRLCLKKPSPSPNPKCIEQSQKEG